MVNYQTINANSITPVSAGISDEELLTAFGDAKIFSKLDLSCGYHQVKMDSESKPLTAFVTHMGVFQYTRMPFGLSGALNTFIRTLSAILKEFLFCGVVMYVDDILVYSDTFSQHLQLIQDVFQILSDYAIILNENKCEFCVEETQFLGHVIRHRSVQPIIKKTDAIKNWPPIKTKKGAQSFLGTVNYFQTYTAHCAQKPEGLCEFIKGKLKDNDTKVSQSVQQLKDALTSKPVLIPLIPNADIKIYCDASNSAAGAIIEMWQNNKKVGVLA